MKQQLTQKYLDGKTTPQEEQQLLRMLQAIPEAERTQSEISLLLMLSTADLEDEEDIFSVDHTEEYDEIVKPHRTIKLWPWLAAACVAGMLFIFLTPPRGNEDVPNSEPRAEVKVEEKGTTQQEERIKEEENHASEKLSTPVPHTQPQSTRLAKTTISSAKSSRKQEVTEDVAVDEPTEQALSESREEALKEMLACDYQCLDERIEAQGYHFNKVVKENLD